VACRCIDCVPALPGRASADGVSDGVEAVLPENVNSPALLMGAGSTLRLPSKSKTVFVAPERRRLVVVLDGDRRSAARPDAHAAARQARLNVSFGSSTASSSDVRWIVFCVSPGANVSVPDAAV